MKKARFSILASLLLAFALPAFAADSPSDPVTQQQLKVWTDWLKRSMDYVNQKERNFESSHGSKSSSSGSSAASSAGSSKDEEAVDLGGSMPAFETGRGGSGATPKLTTYFDLNLINQPGTANSLAFDNYHSFLFFDIAPTPDLTFSFNLLGPQTLPIYYELDYKVARKLTFRAGKIWVPFDDLSSQSPHSIFGGRVGLQQLMPTTSGNDGNLFLPSVWTELGVGMKWMVVDTSKLKIESHLCVLNGFTDGGTDPVTQSHDYPNFTEYSPATQASSGNHRGKSIAARAHAQFFNQFGFGVSYYSGQWNEDSDPSGPLGLSILGLDLQYRFSLVELRAGLANMNVSLPGSVTAKRGGTYIEAGVPMGSKWKVLFRLGALQLDSRVYLPTDETVGGGTLLYNLGMVQFSLEHSRALTRPNVPLGFSSYTDLRMITMF